MGLPQSLQTRRTVTPGAFSGRISRSVTSVIGEIVVGENVDFNGFGLSTGDGDTLRWSVSGAEKSGTVEPAKSESSWTRLTVADDALAELASEEYDGKTDVFTVRGNFASAKISATLKYAVPDPEMTRVYNAEAEVLQDGFVNFQKDIGIDGVNLRTSENDQLLIRYRKIGESTETKLDITDQTELYEWTPTHILVKKAVWDEFGEIDLTAPIRFSVSAAGSLPSITATIING